jgi:type III pantothenate kinase
MPPLITVDIGNTRIKLGQFAAPGVSVAPGNQRGVPIPVRTLAMPTEGWNPQELQKWLAHVAADTPWWIASVNRPAAAKLNAWIADRWPKRMLADTDLPITAAVDHPERVGIDRLAAAVAANRLRDPARAAIIVCLGSAITVNLLTADGAFRGGAILPGIAMSARALDQFTDMLPLSPMDDLAGAPPALGTSTLEAIHSGLFWGAVGAIRELIARLSGSLPQMPGDGSRGNSGFQIFLTGGAAPSVAQYLGTDAMYVEHLVLAGIALAKPAERV